MNKSPKYIFEHETDRAKEIAEAFPISSLPVLNNNREIVEVIVFKNNTDLTSKVKCNKES